MRLQEIKERLEKYTLAEDTDNEMSVEDFTAALHDFRTHVIGDMNYLIDRIRKYSAVNVKLSQEYIESMERIERYEKVIHDIAFGYVEGDYADVRQYAREAL